MGCSCQTHIRCIADLVAFRRRVKLTIGHYPGYFFIFPFWDARKSFLFIEILILEEIFQSDLSIENIY